MSEEECIQNIDNLYAGKPSIGLYEMISNIFNYFNKRACERCVFGEEMIGDNGNENYPHKYISCGKLFTEMKHKDYCNYFEEEDKK